MHSTSHRSRLCSLLGLVVVAVVAAPTVVAAYRHARDVVGSVGDPVMAPWLPASIVGLLLAALGVIWLRRRAGQPAGRGAWAAAGFAMLVLVGANLAVIDRGSMLAYAVAVFPPIALAVTLALVATATLGGGCLVRRPAASRGHPTGSRQVDESGEDTAAAAQSPAGEETTPGQAGAGAPHPARLGQRPPTPPEAPAAAPSTREPRPSGPQGRTAEEPATSESEHLARPVRTDREPATPGTPAEPARQARKRPSPGPTSRAREVGPGDTPPTEVPPAAHGQPCAVPDANPEPPPRATSPRARAKGATVPGVAGSERQEPSDLLSLPSRPDGKPGGRSSAPE